MEVKLVFDRLVGSMHSNLLVNQPPATYHIFPSTPRKTTMMTWSVFLPLNPSWKILRITWNSLTESQFIPHRPSAIPTDWILSWRDYCSPAFAECWCWLCFSIFPVMASIKPWALSSFCVIAGRTSSNPSYHSPLFCTASMNLLGGMMAISSGSKWWSYVLYHWL